jgi:site-specific DNA-methyltransferase (adenine-specific)
MPSYLNVILLGDCLTILREIPGESVDAIVTDPPYGLGAKEPAIEAIIQYLQGGVLDTAGDFMGKDWQIPPVAVWRECFRVLKPGGHLLSFGGTRTFDLISLGIRAAGFENRDTLATMFGGVLSWIHGQGFPKSHSFLKTGILPEIERQLREQGVEGEIQWRK